MDIILRAAALAVIGSILALLLKKYTPELSLLTVMAAAMAVVWLSVSLCGKVLDVLDRAVKISAGASMYIGPVMRCVGIGLVSNLAAQVCKDAQQGTAASAVEICGVFCALYCALPLVESLLSVVEKLL